MDLEKVKGFNLYLTLRRWGISRPEKVEQHFVTAHRHCDHLLSARLHALFGSARRRAGDLAEARLALEIAEEKARQIHDEWCLYDVWQRTAHVYGDRLEFKRALRLSEKAALGFATTVTLAKIERRIGEGRATFDMGLWLKKQGKPEAGISKYRRALRLLPHSEIGSRLAAFQNISNAYREMGETEEALDWLVGMEKAASVASRPFGREVRSPLSRTQAIEYQGWLLMSLGRWEEAVSRLEFARALYGENSFEFEMALCTIPLCRALFECTRIAEARVVALETAEKLRSAKGNPLAHRAITILTTTVWAQRRLDEPLLDELLGMVERARSSAGRALDDDQP